MRTRSPSTASIVGPWTRRCSPSSCPAGPGRTRDRTGSAIRWKTFTPSTIRHGKRRAVRGDYRTVVDERLTGWQMRVSAGAGLRGRGGLRGMPGSGAERVGRPERPRGQHSAVRNVTTITWHLSVLGRSWGPPCAAGIGAAIGSSVDRGRRASNCRRAAPARSSRARWRAQRLEQFAFVGHLVLALRVEHLEGADLHRVVVLHHLADEPRAERQDHVPEVTHALPACRACSSRWRAPRNGPRPRAPRPRPPDAERRPRRRLRCPGRTGGARRSPRVRGPTCRRSRPAWRRRPRRTR